MRGPFVMSLFVICFLFTQSFVSVTLMLLILQSLFVLHSNLLTLSNKHIMSFQVTALHCRGFHSLFPERKIKTNITNNVSLVFYPM